MTHFFVVVPAKAGIKESLSARFCLSGWASAFSLRLKFILSACLAGSRRAGVASGGDSWP